MGVNGAGAKCIVHNGFYDISHDQATGDVYLLDTGMTIRARRPNVQNQDRLVQLESMFE